MSLEKELEYLPRFKREREIRHNTLFYNVTERARINWRDYTTDNGYVIGISGDSLVFLDEIQSDLENPLVFVNLVNIQGYQKLEDYPPGTKVKIQNNRFEVIKPS